MPTTDDVPREYAGPMPAPHSLERTPHCSTCGRRGHHAGTFAPGPDGTGHWYTAPTTNTTKGTP